MCAHHGLWRTVANDKRQPLAGSAILEASLDGSDSKQHKNSGGGLRNSLCFVEYFFAEMGAQAMAETKKATASLSGVVHGPEVAVHHAVNQPDASQCPRQSQCP